MSHNIRTFWHYTSVKNILILWDGGSAKKEIERSEKNTLIANLIANLIVV